MRTNNSIVAAMKTRLEKDSRITKVINAYPNKSSLVLGIYTKVPDVYIDACEEVKDLVEDTNDIYHIFMLNDTNMPDQLKKLLESDCEVLYDNSGT